MHVRIFCSALLLTCCVCLQEVVLWQQRAFASALQKLMTRLGSDWHSQLPRKAPLVLALALLLAQVPAALYRTELPDLLPLIASGLQHLPETSLADGEGALSLLQVLSAGFEDARGEALQCLIIQRGACQSCDCSRCNQGFMAFG